MRRILLLAAILVCVYLPAQNWTISTNTNHIYDLSAKGNDLYLATWGGVLQLSPGNDSSSLNAYTEKKIYQKGTGLVSNDIRTLSYIDFSSSLWMGSSDNGISILSQLGIQN
ncbi:MAG TPA: hypothetical protein P5252_08115, partial [Candidatus Cloacimonas sp.]|nr:hypothetical protein [Candidatus Cloacimonas sp.]